jgi:hypothetical protein
MKPNKEEIMKAMDRFFKTKGFDNRPDPIDVMMHLDKLYAFLVTEGLVGKDQYDVFVGGANAAFLRCPSRR